MRVLVTGASGFIGQSLVHRLLEDGHWVRALARRTPGAGSGHPRLEYLAADLTDHAALDGATRGMDAIVHLAAATGVSDPAIVRAVNVDGTRALLDAAKRHGVRRFVFVSSVSATRRRPGPYGRSKLEGERLVAESGLEWVTLRPSLVYGTASTGLFAALAAHLKKLPVVPLIGGGRVELHPIHVEDVNAVIAGCLGRFDVVHRSYDLLGPDAVTFRDFLALVARTLGVRKPTVYVPGWVAMAVAALGSRFSRRPALTVDHVIGLTSPAQVDRAPLARDFDVEWIRLEAGLQGEGRAAAGGGAPARAASAPSSAPASDAGGYAFPLPALLAEAPRPSRPVRVGVVGLGRMGMTHTAVLSMIPNVEVAGFVDHHPAHAKPLRGMGHAAPVFRSVDLMIDAVRPDAVFVCTPQHAHLAVARLALEGGCAVFVEKPLAHTLADAAKLADLAAEKRRPVACGYTLAYQPVFAIAQHALATGALGAVTQARSSMYLSQVFGPRRGWMYERERSGGGVVANIASHLLFLLEWYLGTPVEVRATASRLYGEVEDELHGMMRLASGAEVGFDSSWSVPGYPLSAVVIEIEGDNGKMLVSNDAIELDLRGAAGGWAAGHTRLGVADLPQPARFDVNGEGYYLEDAAFLAWATGGTPPPATVDAALRVQRVMDALYRSADANGQPVKVSG